MNDDERLLSEIQRHDMTLTRVTQFQTDQVEINRRVAQKLTSNRKLIEKLQRELEAIKRLIGGE